MKSIMKSLEIEKVNFPKMNTSAAWRHLKFHWDVIKLKTPDLQVERVSYSHVDLHEVLRYPRQKSQQDLNTRFRVDIDATVQRLLRELF